MCQLRSGERTYPGEIDVTVDIVYTLKGRSVCRFKINYTYLKFLGHHPTRGRVPRRNPCLHCIRGILLKERRQRKGFTIKLAMVDIPAIRLTPRPDLAEEEKEWLWFKLELSIVTLRKS